MPSFVIEFETYGKPANDSNKILHIISQGQSQGRSTLVEWFRDNLADFRRDEK